MNETHRYPKGMAIAKPREKVIFLDIDGVLATMKDGYGHDIDLEKIHIINRLCMLADAKIILCSSWREKNLPKTLKFLPELLRTNIIDQTPDLSGKRRINGSARPERLRYDEIWKSLQKHNADAYVVIDDDPEPYKDTAMGWCCLLTPDPKEGITEELAEQALLMLNHPWEITDADTRQRCRILVPDRKYEYEQQDSNGNTVSDIIDLDDYTLDEEFRKKYLAPYGYDYNNIKDFYDNDWKQIIAECIFEVNND